jgi:hypothetical protein
MALVHQQAVAIDYAPEPRDSIPKRGEAKRAEPSRAKPKGWLVGSE